MAVGSFYDNKDKVYCELMASSDYGGNWTRLAPHAPFIPLGQNGTFGPSSCASASAIAVLPVPGAPASISARPAIFFVLISSTTTPHASRAFSCPTRPDAIGSAVDSGKLGGRLERHNPNRLAQDAHRQVDLPAVPFLAFFRNFWKPSGNF